jgi:hypothetical protein
MNDIQKRFLLFLFGCIGIRLLLVYVAKNSDNFSNKQIIEKLLIIFTLTISIGFFTIFFTGIRKTGQETFGDKIWWNNLRPLHGFLYLLFAILFFQEKSYAWIILLVDVLIGLISFLVFHYYSGNFNKLLI